MKRVITFLALAATVIAPLVYSASIAQAAVEPDHIKGQIIIKYRDSRAASAALKQYGLSDGQELGDTGAHLIRVPEGKEATVIEALSHNPAIEYAETDAIVQATSYDTYFDRQHALQNTGQSFTNNAGTVAVLAGKNDADIDAPEAWQTTTGNGVTVAVLDSGVTTDNLDISPKVTLRANFSTAATGEDNYGHGTHVAGIVAAIKDNDAGVAGVCPGCTILSGKVLNDSGYGSVSSVVNGIKWATDNNARIINMSLGFNQQSKALETAVNNAWSKGAVLVAAAGNDNNLTKEYPAAYTNVIAVAATNNQDQRASFSTYGSKWVDIAAPGDSVFSTFPNHSFYIQTEYGRSQGYDIGSGTSMASPIVSGVVALTLASHPGSTNTYLRSKVQSSADKIVGTGTYWANGRVNADQAVK